MGKFGVSLLLSLTICPAAAQPKPAVTSEDYGKWERLRSGVLAPDGQWLACLIERVNEENELRIRKVGSDSLKTVAYGTDPAFSDDSRWLAYGIGYSVAEREKLKKAKKPVQNKMGLLDPGSGEELILDDVSSFTFNDNGAYLAIRGYPAQKQESDDSSDDSSAPRPADLVVRNLSTGATTHFGSVTEWAWQDEGSLLALTVESESKVGNGVQIYDAESGHLRTLDSSQASYRGLSWRKDADDLAVLRSRTDEARQDPTHLVLIWRDLAGTAPRHAAYDHSADADFPEGMRIVDFHPLQWADDGSTLSFGIKEWEEKAEETGEEGEKDEKPGLDIWHSRDRRIIPMQKKQADRDRKRSYLAAWHPDSNQFVRLGTDLMEDISLLEGERFALERDTRPYRFGAMFGRRYQDLYLIDAASGERKQIAERVRYVQGSSSTGSHVLYLKDDDYWTYEVATGQTHNISKKVPTPVVDLEDDHPSEQKPPYGTAGWTKSDRSVLVYDKYDVWSLSPDGSEATRLSNGAPSRIRHRYVRLDPEEEYIDLSRPLYLSLYGEWTKKYGYARIAGKTPERLLFADKRIGSLARAEKAEIYAYTVEDFDDSPDYFAGSAELRDSPQLTRTNPYQGDYAWGRSQLIDYKNKRGHPLQGALFYPAGYEPGKTHPMIVYTYEIRSNVVHDYVVPSERSPYNTSVFTSQGYFVFQPDIVYRERDPGLSAVDCVSSGIEKVLETGMVDRSAIGLVGHSWGGYQASFIPTQTNLFAASVAGAPLTNFLSMMGTIHWNQGLPELSHWETGQARMAVPSWEDFDAHVRNSPAAFVHKLETPMLVMFGDADGTVDWHQGVELYNFARRAAKQLVMLVYHGENHSLRKKPNQIDYHRRILEWFGHYLKKEEAPKWIREGVSFLEHEEELERTKARP